MNPLAELNDIHAAPDPGFWPLAPGWWVAMVLLIVIGMTISYLLRRYRLQRRRQAILDKFEAVFARYQDAADTVSLAADLHQLIRRLMLACGDRQQIGLVGDAFLGFLDQASDGAPFSEGAGRALLDWPYRPVDQVDSSLDAQALYAAVLQWAQQRVWAA